MNSTASYGRNPARPVQAAQLYSSSSTTSYSLGTFQIFCDCSGTPTSLRGVREHLTARLPLALDHSSGQAGLGCAARINQTYFKSYILAANTEKGELARFSLGIAG